MLSKLILIFLFSISSSFSWGAEFYSIELSDIKNGKLKYALSRESTKWQLVKNTNLFDGDLELGDFEISNSKVIEKELKELKSYYEILKQIDKDMKGLEVSGGNAFKHQRYYQLGEFKVDGIDPYFDDITKIFETIHRKIKSKLISGITAKEVKSKLFIQEYSKGKKKGMQEQMKCSLEKTCIHAHYGTLFY